jgi:hypothetical protein
MLAHLRPLVHVAALSTGLGGILTLDSQAGWIDPDTALAAACGPYQSHFSEEVDQLRQAIWSRIVPVSSAPRPAPLGDVK